MPTAARQKYLAKQAAKKSDLLSDTDRQAEYDKVMSQLTQVSDPEVDKFEALMSEWVRWPSPARSYPHPAACAQSSLQEVSVPHVTTNASFVRAPL